MVILTYVIVDEDNKITDGPYERSFEGEAVMWEWLQLQNQHPWLSVKTLKVVE